MRKLGLLVVAAAIAAPTPTLAQTMTTDANGVTVVDDTREREDDDNDFPWGLLGLIGLAGLLGRKKHDRDIHVDTRNDRK